MRHYGVDERKIRIIHRGVDLEVFNPANLDECFMEDFRARYNLRDRFVVSSVGRITPLKGYETFIEAIGLVRERKENVVGLIVGGVRSDKREYFKSLQKLVAKMGLQEHIIFTGSISKIAEIYALSDVVVSSSKKPESFGRSIVEAMALNTPVVASAHGGALDIIKDGYGALFTVGDAMDLAKKIVSVEQKDYRSYVAKHFSLEQMVAKTIAVYKEVV